MTEPVIHEVTPGPALRETFLGGETFADLLAREKQNSLLWDALYQRAMVPDSIVARAKMARHPWHLLVLSEDWCGDSINTLFVIEHGLALPNDERYREVRTWYARDDGETALNELLDIIERAESLEDRAETSG